MHNLNDLYFFALVVEHHGFSAAARATGLQKTKLSRHVAHLEQHLGMQLLKRSTRQLSLTRAGEVFYAQCQRVLAESEQAFQQMEELKVEPSGSVKVTCPIGLMRSYLGPILPSFVETFPLIQLEVEVTDRRVSLLEENVDVVLRAREQLEDTADVFAQTLLKVRMVVVAAPSLFPIQLPPRHPQELSAWPTIGLQRQTREGTEQWWLREEGSDLQPFTVTPRLFCNEYVNLAELCLAGAGVALLPLPLVQNELRAGRLMRLLPHWNGREHLVHLLYTNPKSLPSAVRSFIDFVAIELPKRFGPRGQGYVLGGSPSPQEALTLT